MEGGGGFDKFPSSCRIVAFDSRIGVNGRSEPTINQPPDCRIVAGGEEGDSNRNALNKYNSSNENLIISKGVGNINNLNTDLNNNSVGGNTQFPSRCNSGHPAQLSRFNNSVGGNNQFPSRCESCHSDQLSRFNFRNDSSPHIQYGEARPVSHGKHGGVGQFQPHPNGYKPDHIDQYPDGTHANRGKRGEDGNMIGTPKRTGIISNKRKLFEGIKIDEEGKDVVPLDTDLEILLINSCKINVMKVQTIVNNFMIDRNYSTIFCMTETKVKGHDFQPVGIKMFSKHRGGKEKKGGGLALGYDEKANIKLEEIETGSKDILGVEGRVNNRKCRIILCYFDCTKQLSGEDYKRNRLLQTKVESLLEVDPDTFLMVLGDMNGRLVELEPNIKSDANGEMVKLWVEQKNMIHLNALETCRGKYTFSTVNGRSAIDHVLVNENMRQKHLSMWVDEDKTMLDISDHNLVRVWFRMGNNNYRGGKKKPRKRITWISRHPTNIAKCVKNVKARIGRRHGFKHYGKDKY